MERDVHEKLQLEIRRGAIVLAVLGQLRKEHYGYSLRRALAEHGIHVEEGTLYPLVRRLETQGLLTSEWREDAKRKKRFYALSALGQETLSKLTEEWLQLNHCIESLLKENV
ncbi:MAG: PadR family transcriptional regulator [Gammaproteobacteria bacterium]